MKAITIRGIDPVVAEKLKSMAAKHNKSLNQLVLEFIKKNLGMTKEKKYSKKYDDLDHLFGTWNDEEFNTIQGKISRDRKIDMELWHE